MPTSKIRIIACLILGVLAILQGFGMMDNINIVTQVFGLAVMGFGLLMIVYGFTPSTAKQIIKAIVQIVSIPLRKMFG